MKKLFRWLIVLWFVVYSALFTPLAYAASAGGWSFSAFDVSTSVAVSYTHLTLPTNREV